MAKKFLDESGLETLWSKVKSEDNSKLSEAKTYAETQASNALSSAKSYADEKVKDAGGITSDDLANTLASAKSYADGKDSISVGGNTTITNTTGVNTSKLTVYPYYNSGGPTTYGNILSISGLQSNACGGSQLALEWSGNQNSQDDNVGGVYYRSQRDNQYCFTNWKKLAFDDVATTSSNGLMSATDKSKLDNLATTLATTLADYVTKSDSKYFTSFNNVDYNAGVDLRAYHINTYKNLVVRYGSFQVTAKTTYNITFGSAAGYYYRVVTQDTNAQADSANSGYVTSASSTGFSFVSKSNTSRYVEWIAIGVK